MRLRSAVAAVTTAAAALALLTPVAAAHGIVGRKDSPIPDWLFGWAAGFVLLISFVALDQLWSEPKLARVRERRRRLLPMPAWVDVICGALGIALFGFVVYCGFAGTQTPVVNLAPIFVFVFFWVGMVPIQFLLGDVFRVFNPWRALARAIAWAAGRATRGKLPDPLAYPERLGRWPAVAGITAFAILELAVLAATRNDPSTVALLALAFAALQLVGMSLYGIDRWTDRGDGFSVYYGMLAKLSPFERRDGVLYLRPPLAGVTSIDPVSGTVPLLILVIGSTAFDGALAGPVWQDVGPDLSQRFINLGFSPGLSLEIATGVGLFTMVALVGGIYAAGVAGMRSIGKPEGNPNLARAFAHSLVPIALAYIVAHYFSLLMFEGQRIAYLISNPLGRDLPPGDGGIFGTAGSMPDYEFLSATTIWYVQVGALVVGHVAALVLAHDRALELYSGSRQATRSQYWMLVVMIGFTSLGLWLLSAGL